MGGVAASSYTAGVFLVAALFETPVWLIAGAKGGISGDDWLYLVLLAVFSLAAGMGAMAWAQRHVSVAVSSVLSLGATVITAIGAWVFFDQPLAVAQIIGGLVVLVSLAGIVTVQLGRHEGATTPS
jgi:drug/metabolite transporter (DMT)-like permease